MLRSETLAACDGCRFNLDYGILHHNNFLDQISLVGIRYRRMQGCRRVRGWWTVNDSTQYRALLANNFRQSSGIDFVYAGHVFFLHPLGQRFRSPPVARGVAYFADHQASYPYPRRLEPAARAREQRIQF